MIHMICESQLWDEMKKAPSLTSVGFAFWACLITSHTNVARPHITSAPTTLKARTVMKVSRFVLFDSRRDYLEQMDAYNAWKEGDEE